MLGLEASKNFRGEEEFNISGGVGEIPRPL
jgi:hypothetical protein